MQCAHHKIMTSPFHSSLRGEALSYHEQKGRQTPQTPCFKYRDPDTSERPYLPWSSGYWYLSDGHLLGHGSLARRARGTNAGGSASLLLEDLPELETLIGS
jgi:hypothetical protein